jgi:16S rRNA C967 or C1407 C5-methylase (RsmB/RsmF family)
VEEEEDAQGGSRGGTADVSELTSNPNLETYYTALGLFDAEDQKALFGVARTILPTNFRVFPASPNADLVLRQLQERFAHLLDRLSPEARSAVFAEMDVEPVAGELGPFPLAWSGGLAWQVNLARRRMRKVEVVRDFLTFLRERTETGELSRQEAVSMLPPLVLDVQPHHRVLDMCAAPGSKTAQIVEALHARENEEGLPSGFVVANDLNPKRAFLLAHQVGRGTSPSFLVVCHDASVIPDPSALLRRASSLRRLARDQAAIAEAAAIAHERAAGYFDRVLADVPCSGDGTMRKNLDVWPRFSPASGLLLHATQLSIAKRGCQLLSDRSGRIVYSTCSMNPIEDEAVVAELLRWAAGGLRLLDSSTLLPGLKRRAGVSHWPVMDALYRRWPSPRFVADVLARAADPALPTGPDALRALRALQTATAAEADVRQADAEAEQAEAAQEAAQEAAVVLDDGDEGQDGERRGGLLKGLPPATATVATSVEEEALRLRSLPEPRRTRRILALSHMPISLWPPTALEAADMHLDRCIRVAPHDQNSGGFFVAVLERTGPVPMRSAHRPEKAATSIADAFDLRNTRKRDRDDATPAPADAKRPRPEDPGQEDAPAEPLEDDDDHAAAPAAVAAADAADAAAGAAVAAADAADAAAGAAGADATADAASAAAEGAGVAADGASSTAAASLPRWLLESREWMIPDVVTDPSRSGLLQRPLQNVRDVVSREFGLPASFPWDCVWMRTSEGSGLIYVPPTMSREVLEPTLRQAQDQFLARQAPLLLRGWRPEDVPKTQPRLNVVVGGLRIFELRGRTGLSVGAVGEAAARGGEAFLRRITHPPVAGHTSVRLESEGAYIVAPFLGRRVVDISMDELGEILASAGPFIPAVDLTSALASKLARVPSGSVLLRLDPALPNYDGVPTDRALLGPRAQLFVRRAVVPLWNAGHNVSCMCARQGVTQLLRLLTDRGLAGEGIRRGAVLLARHKQPPHHLRASSSPAAVAAGEDDDQPDEKAEERAEDQVDDDDNNDDDDDNNDDDDDNNDDDDDAEQEAAEHEEA